MGWVCVAWRAGVALYSYRTSHQYINSMLPILPVADPGSALRAPQLADRPGKRCIDGLRTTKHHARQSMPIVRA